MIIQFYFLHTRRHKQGTVLTTLRRGRAAGVRMGQSQDGRYGRGATGRVWRRRAAAAAAAAVQNSRRGRGRILFIAAAGVMMRMMT